MNDPKRRETSSTKKLFTTEEISHALKISRVTISKKAKQLKLDLKREKFNLVVVRYQWSKQHIRLLIESLKGEARREHLLQEAAEKGLI